MSSFFQELKRRNVVRVAVAYLVLGWLVLQITDLVAPALHLPEWTMSMVTFLGIIGFPFALLLAWAFELTPQGLRRSEDVAPEESITRQTAGKLNKAIIGLLTMVVVVLLSDRFFGLSDSLGRAVPEPVITVPDTASVAPKEDEARPQSIAVLPFVNMSDDQSQEYFSDGISEELLNALAKIRELRVAARTSSFAFKGKNQDITDIGDQLNVETILEGSVRKSGKRVRITAQLINVEDGYHLWSETYDRDLTDIFAVQDEISAAIVEALKVHLTDAPADAPPARKVNPDAYNFVLQGRHNVRLRTRDSMALAIAQFQQALDIDPDYAEAWAGKAMATQLSNIDQYGDIPLEKSERLAQQYLDRAFELDPDLGGAHAAQALVYYDRNMLREALSSINRALEIHPSEGYLYLWKHLIIRATGDYRGAVAALEQAFAVDPLHYAIRVNWMDYMASNGRAEEIRRLVTPGSWEYYLAEWRIAGYEGRWADMVRVMEEAGAQGVGDEHQRNNFRAMAHGFNLLEFELAAPYVPPHASDQISAIRNPDSTIARLRDSRVEDLSAGEKHVLIVALVNADGCADVLEILSSDDLESDEPMPAPAGSHSRGAYAADAAWCLRQLGESGRAHALGARVEAAIRQQESQGVPRRENNVNLIISLIAQEKDEEAVEVLRESIERHEVDAWSFFQAPYFDPLEPQEDYRALKAGYLEKLNSERSSLGLDPIPTTEF